MRADPYHARVIRDEEREEGRVWVDNVRGYVPNWEPTPATEHGAWWVDDHGTLARPFSRFDARLKPGDVRGGFHLVSADTAWRLVGCRRNGVE